MLSTSITVFTTIMATATTYYSSTAIGSLTIRKTSSSASLICERASTWMAPQNCVVGLPLLFVLVFYSIVLTLVGPGLNALMIPHPFACTMPLRGTEFDFSSDDASCLEWISANPSCGWRVSTILVCIPGDALFMEIKDLQRFHIL
jgi:hypothetical protein